MKPQENLFEYLAERVTAGERVCLLVVVASSGSVPQKAGACAVVGEQGLRWGTIGGGRLESDSIQQAIAVLRTQQPFLLEIDLAENYSREAGPICGGKMQVLGIPISETHQGVVCQLAKKDHGVAALTLRGEGQGQLTWQADPSKSDANCFYLPIEARPRLVIVGAGHCGRAIAELGDWLGFDIVVCDERAEWLDVGAFPPSATLTQTAMTTFTDGVTIDRNTYIALVSMGHRSDAEALESCIDCPAAYIGMIGSRRKVAMLRQHFLSTGLASVAQWDRLHTPIGLEIGAESIREIATSVLAEITQVRRKLASGGSRS